MTHSPLPVYPRRPPVAEEALSREQVLALWEVSRLANEDLELRPMMQRVTDGLAARFGWELVALVGVHHDENRFECEAVTTSLSTVVRPGYSRELGSGVVGCVALTGQSIVLDDVRDFLGFVETLGKTASEICVPVWSRGQVVAVLNAESVEPARFSDQLLLFEAVAEQISGAVARGLLYEEVRARTDILETLAEVSRRVVDFKSLEPRLQGLVEYLRERFDLIVAAIMVSDDDGEFWQERAISMTPVIPIHRTRWPIGAGIVGRAVTQGRTELVSDVTADPEYISINDEVRCELVVPLKFGGRVLGALNMESKDPSLLSAASVRTFEAIGHQLAGAIELAVSHRRLSQSQSELAEANRELNEVNRVLSQLTLVDDLTGIANRRRLSQSLDDELRRAQRHGEPVTLALFDVDFFKAYNDAHGHLAGDQCLRRVAVCLASHAVRAGELVARYGGEEFAFVLPRVEARDVFEFIDQVRSAVGELKIEHPDSEVADVLTLSAGVASVLPEAGSSVDALLAKADDALYQAKRTGRDCTVCFEDLVGTPDE